MFKKILLPLDGSELAEATIPYAENLAAKIGSNITLIYVTSEEKAKYRHMHNLYTEKLMEEMRRNTKKRQAKTGGEAINIESVVMDGDPPEQIINYAEKEDFGLIIMATHGQSGLRRWALGNITDKVLRATKTPLLIVRTKGMRPKGILKKIVAPLDGSKEAEAILPYIEELASKLKAGVQLIQVSALPDTYYVNLEELKKAKAIGKTSKQYMQKIATQLEQKGIPAKIKTKEVISSSQIAQEIIDLAEETNADMVMMATHGQSGFTRWALGSVAESVMRASPTPVMLIRSPKSGSI